jgi:hypothetical protein
MGSAYEKVRMNENGPMPGFSVAQSDALKKKMRSLRWQPDVVMRETVLIQRLREMMLMGAEE